jgi:hypothetical protein
MDARSRAARLSLSEHTLANALAALAMRQKNAARMEEALTCMRSAVEVYQQGKETYWLPIAQRRVTASAISPFRWAANW